MARTQQATQPTEMHCYGPRQVETSYGFRFRVRGERGHFRNLCSKSAHIVVTGRAAAMAKMREMSEAYPHIEFKLGLTVTKAR